MYFSIFERIPGGFGHVYDLWAATAEAALAEHVAKYGDNYGKVMVMRAYQRGDEHLVFSQ